MPPAPLRTVVEVEAKVLGSAEPGHADLIQHGPAARRRRYSRAIGIGRPDRRRAVRAHLVDRSAAARRVDLAAVAAAGRAAGPRPYRNLGHAVVDNRLITRAGSLVRRRIVLAVPGVIGVTMRQSMFQRRSGLITVTATTAAGAQHYEVPDVPLGRPTVGRGVAAGVPILHDRTADRSQRRTGERRVA